MSSLQWLKAVDPWLTQVATPLAWLLQARRRPRAGRPIAPTLIIRPGGMGDLILLTYAIEQSGLRHQDYEFLIERRAAPWARRLGLQTHYIEDWALDLVRAPWRWFARHGRYRSVIVSEQLFGLVAPVALWCREAGGEVRGFQTNRAWRYWDGAVNYVWDDRHEVGEFVRLLGQPGLSPALPRRRHAPATDEHAIAVSGLVSPSRAIAAERMAEHALAWLERAEQVHGRKPEPWVAAAPADRAYARELADRLSARLGIPVPVESEFDRVCDRLIRSRALLTVEGGLLHVASYYGVAASAIFTSSIAAKWAPTASESRVISTLGLKCQPCAAFAQVPRCLNDYNCKRLIEPADVAAGYPDGVHRPRRLIDVDDDLGDLTPWELAEARQQEEDRVFLDSYLEKFFGKKPKGNPPA